MQRLRPGRFACGFLIRYSVAGRTVLAMRCRRLARMTNSLIVDAPLSDVASKPHASPARYRLSMRELRLALQVIENRPEGRYPEVYHAPLAASERASDCRALGRVTHDFPPNEAPDAYATRNRPWCRPAQTRLAILLCFMPGSRCRLSVAMT